MGRGEQAQGFAVHFIAGWGTVTLASTGIGPSFVPNLSDTLSFIAPIHEKVSLKFPGCQISDRILSQAFLLYEVCQEERLHLSL